jgi:diguanylate cyclase (GGDEF)-like protein/PAS domain S-box-containing protein
MKETNRKDQAVTGKLLIIDDNPINLGVVVEHLEQAGYEVLVALDGEEALKRAAYSRPDLILLDVMMPGIDGFGTCRRLKADPVTADIPVIFMTALDDVSDKVAAFQAGGVDYVSKPFQPEELLARVRTHLALRRAQLALAERNEALETEIGARRDAEAALRSSEQSFRRLFETADDGIALLDPELGTIIDVNTRMLDLVRRSRGEMIGRSFVDMPAFAGVRDWSAPAEDLRRLGLFKAEEWTLKRSDGARVVVEVTATTCEAGGRKLAQWNFRDISNRKEAEERIRYLALHDPLTGLANRAKFFDRLQHALAGARRNGGKVAVLAIDLDHFKAVNDTHGHLLGDRLLEAVAGRIMSGLRESDTAARIGGDEFVVALPDLAPEEDAEQVAARLLAMINQPFPIDGKTLRISASVGISHYPEDASDASGLVRAADTAMYRAKRSGRGATRLFTYDLSLAAERWHTLSQEIEGACERGEFTLHYQPQVAIENEAIIGVEALLRWEHPVLGLIGPEHFVPLLEERGMMVEVGRWAIEQACRQNMAWQQAGFEPVRIAVNLSAQQFHREDLVDTVAQALAASGLAPQWLELELTESLTLDDADVTLEIMRRLKALGVALSLDDFGTGWSSLAYLRRFPLDRIKIDRTFIRDLAHHESTAAIVHAIVDLARQLGLDCIAEGVETEEQQKLLLRDLCPGMQGYLFSRPVPSDQMEAILRRESAGSIQAA